MDNRFASFIYQPMKPLGSDGTMLTASSRHIRISHDAALSGMVLLKNEKKVLPLKKKSMVALFGKTQYDTIKGGGGSGDVTCAYSRNINEGMKLMERQGLLTLYSPLADFYKGYFAQATPGDHGTKEADVPADLVKRAAKDCDVAVITIGRFSWEGGDRREYEFSLSVGEESMIARVCEYFENVVVVLNVVGPITTGWIADNEKIKGALMAWCGGMEGGAAVAELLCGIVNPSGHLTDTLARDYMDYPGADTFNESKDYANYTEDIFVGYRYFETIPGAAEKVVYPFGYGLSYTTFDIKEQKCWTEAAKAKKGVASLSAEAENGLTIHLNLEVKNTGRMAGRQVVQVYLNAPAVKLTRASRELVAFKKTKLLKPGEKELIAFDIDLRAAAAFDDIGAVKMSARVLEAGEYRLFYGSSVRDTEVAKTVFVLDNDLAVEQLSSKVAPTALSKRMLADGSYVELEPGNNPDSPCTTEMEGWTLPQHGLLTHDMLNEMRLDDARRRTQFGEDPESRQRPDFMKVAEGKMSIEEFVGRLPIEVLIEMLGGQPNTGVADTFGMGNFMEYNIPNVMTTDGPAGVRIRPERGMNTTAFPSATLLACSWDPDILSAVGFAAGMETKENHMGMWLAPGMNIHRNPLCGRNFEYYSEDPLLTGLMATAMVTGIQQSGTSACIKHFCCNNKEEDRMRCDARVSERALRDIYLKGFEICIKNAHPWSLMTCYNRVNGLYPSENRELLQGILRDEWGYDGMVTTDWLNRVSQVNEIKAGNDLKMPAGEPERVLKAVESGELSRSQIEACAVRILKTILRMGGYEIKK